MTLKEFFAIAKRARWVFTTDGDIRTTDVPEGRVRKGTVDLCPLAYVTLAVNGKANWTPDGARLDSFVLDVPKALYRPFKLSSSSDLINKVISGADFATVGEKRNQDRRWLARGLGIWKR